MSNRKKAQQGRRVVSHKPYTIDDEASATLADWFRCFHADIKRQPEIWLRGYTPDQIRAALHQVLCEQEGRTVYAGALHHASAAPGSMRVS